MARVQQANLKGILPAQAERHIRELTTAVGDNAESIDKLQQAGFVTAAQLPSLQSTQTELSAAGHSPLNVTNLLGVLSQPQTPYLQTLTTLPAINSPLSQNGVVIIYSNALYYFVANPIPGKWKPVPTLAVALFGVHSTRLTILASDFPVGTLYLEIDRTLLYVNQLVGGIQFWVYFAGEFACTQSAIPAGLTAQDQGLVIDVRDYSHKLVWGLTRDQAYAAGWSWSPGEEGRSGEVTGFLVDPTGTGWHVCDGSVVSYLKSDGTLGSVTLPNTIASPAYLKFSSLASSAINVAIAPTTGVDSGIGTIVQSGTGATVATHTHSHVVSATGEPVNLVLKAWFRQ